VYKIIIKLQIKRPNGISVILIYILKLLL